MEDIDKKAAREGGRRGPVLVSFRGFTLLELLISLSLLVFIVVIATGAMRIGSRSVAAGEKKMESHERLRTVLAAMDAQIQSHIPLTYEEEGNKKYYFWGDRKTLRFSTNYSVWSGRNGFVVATYKVDVSPDGHEVLSASEQMPGLQERRETRFLETSLISFEYFLKDPGEEQGKWVEALSDGRAIPEKIKVYITQGTKQMSLVFPVRVGAKMMVVQSGTSTRSIR